MFVFCFSQDLSLHTINGTYRAYQPRVCAVFTRVENVGISDQLIRLELINHEHCWCVVSGTEADRAREGDSPGEVY